MDQTKIIVFTDSINLTLPNVDSEANLEILNEVSYDYKEEIPFADERTRTRYSHMTYYRWEVFHNDIFLDYDNVLYLDCDTEVEGPLDGLFKEKHPPMICMAEEKINHLVQQGIPSSNYYCAGVMFATPRAIGKEKLNRMFNALVETVKKRPLNFVDQDIINQVIAMDEFKGLFKPFGAEYDYFNCTCFKWNPKNPIRIRHYAATKGIYEKKYLNP